MEGNSKPPANKRHNKPQAYLVFCESRRNGFSISASARASGVSRPTATRYETLRIADIERENRLLESVGAIASRNEAAELLSTKMRDAEPQYVAGIASTLSRIMGYDAPTRSQVEVRQVPASVITWLDSLDVIDMKAEPITPIEQSNPPKSLPPKASE